MKLLKKTAIAAALASFSFAASAMSPIQDADLSQVSGQDGVSIAASLNVSIGSFVYSNVSGSTSVSFNTIKMNGLFTANLDIINNATFNAILGSVSVGLPATMYAGGDVVQLSIPSTITIGTATPLLKVSVGSIKMGGSNASFGSVAVNGIDLRGTSVWIWAH